MKKTLCVLIVTALLCVLPQASALQLTWNEVNNEDYGASVGAHAFADKLQELSGGELEIDLYTEAALGSEAVSMKGIQMGVLDIFRGNASSLGDWGAEVIGATGLPYLFQSMEEFEEMAVSPLGQEILDSVEAADCGFIALAWMVEGPRNLFVTRQTYEQLGSPEEFTLDMLKDLNIRVPGTKLLNDTVAALGALPVQVDYSEMVQSLASGNIDGAENGVVPYITQGFSEAAPYYITDAHIFGCGVVLVSAETWGKLTEEQKGWMREAGKAASEACYQYNQEQEEASYAQFAEKGVKLLPVADIEAWQSACSEIYKSQSEPVQEMIRRIQAHEF